MWASLLFNIAVAFITAKLTPGPPEPPSSDLQDFNIPVASEGQEIGKPYGTPWVKTLHVAWYGDFKKTKIKDKQSKK